MSVADSRHRIMTTVIVLPIAALTELAILEHDRVQETAIRSHHYGSVETEIFDYSKTKTLALVDGFRDRDGRLTRRAGCVLYFLDGRKWSSAAIGDFKPSADPTLLNFLENKTGPATKTR